MHSRFLCPLLLVLGAMLGVVALIFAPLNQDEGWYLLAAQRVSQGHIPYQDFAFTQAPLLPYVYQAALPLVDHLGVAGGRLFSLSLAMLTLGIVVHSAGRRGGPVSACLAAALLGLNLFQAQYTSTVKTYGLAGLALALAAAAWLESSREHKLRPLLLCALAIAVAAATRFSLILFFVPLGIALLPFRKPTRHRPWLLFSAAGLMGLALLFAPFVFLAQEGLVFGLFEFHAGREVASPWLIKAGFLSRVIQSYFPAALAMGLLLLRRKTPLPGVVALAAAIGAVSLLHLMAPFPYDDYQSALYPALVLLLALELPLRFPESEHRALATATALLCVMHVASSPQLMSWFSTRQDRIWWHMKSQPDLFHLRETAREIRRIDPQATQLLTPDLYLAVEAGLDVPQGLEMGPFSYFPNMETARARRLHVLNRERLQDLLETSTAPLAAFSGYAFSIHSPGITLIDEAEQGTWRRTVERKYRPIQLIHNFGQGSTELLLYKRTPDEIFGE